MSAQTAILFEDIFEVTDVNPKGKSSTAFKNGELSRLEWGLFVCLGSHSG